MSAQRLVAFLALRNRPTHRSYVSGVLWPEATEDHAGGNLRSLLWKVHREAVPLIAVTDSCLGLASDVVIDVDELTAAMNRLARRSTDHEDADVDAVLGFGDLLPGWYEDWVLAERERLRQIRLHALESLCERLTTARRFGQAVEAGLGAVAADPLRESAHRVLIRAHLEEGNPTEALRRFLVYRQLLHDELGLAPTGQMEDLIRGLRDP